MTGSSSSTPPLFPAPASPLPGAAPAFSQVDPLKLLRQHIYLLILTLVVGLVLGVVVEFAWYFLAPRYTTDSQLEARDPLAAPYALSSATSAVSQDQMNSYIQNQVIRLRSDDVLLEALQNPQIRQSAWFASFGGKDTERTARAKEYLQKTALSATQYRGSTLIIVSLTGRQVGDLTTVLDTIVNVFLSHMGLEGENESTSLRTSMLKEQQRAIDDINEINAQITNFMRDNDLPSLGTQVQKATIAYQIIADQESKMQLAVKAAQDAYQSMLQGSQEDRKAYPPDAIAEIERDPAVANRDERIRQLREERQTKLNMGMGENHTYIKNLDNQIAATQVERKREFERLLQARMPVLLETAKKQADGLEAQWQGMQEPLKQANERMRDLTTKLQQYEQLRQRLDDAVQLRDNNTKTLNEERILRSRPDYNRVVRVMAATTPQLTSPNYKIVIPGVTLLCLAGVGGVVYLREMFDQRVKSPSDVHLMSGVDLVGVLPEAADDPSIPTRIESVVQDDPSGLMAESFRQLRTTVVAHMDKHGSKSLLIASPGAGSGVSSVASNLAMSLGYVGRRVLLLDANLRRPNQHFIFGIPQQPGLVEVLRGTATLEQAVFHKVEPSLDILPAGEVRDMPPEMLEGAAFRALLGRLERDYDLIVIDSAPALLTSDAQMLAKHADALLIVARALADKRGMIGRMIRQCEGQRAALLGLLLNRAQASAGGYFKETYEQFYRYRNPPLPTPANPPATPPAPQKV